VSNMGLIQVGTATGAGPVRHVNEDAAFAGGRLLIVADGMGGHAAGEVASTMAVERLSRLANHPHLRPADLHTAVAACNHDILKVAAEDQERSGMGTTLAGIGITRVAGTDHWFVFNIGDSRVYRHGASGLVQVTADHSEVADLVAAGLLHADAARSHPKRNVVTRVLGMLPEPTADVWVFPQTPGERFLICTDGLTTELSDGQIEAVLCAHPAAQPAADALVEGAIAAGGRDNVTVVIVDVLAIRDTVDTVSPR